VVFGAAWVTGKFTGKFFDFYRSSGSQLAKSVTIFKGLQPNSLTDQNREFFALNREINSAEQGN
jgi:hypothetical protein